MIFVLNIICINYIIELHLYPFVNNKQYITYLNIKLIFTAFPVPKLNCIYTLTLILIQIT